MKQRELVGLGAVSGAVLGFEVLLTRVIAIEHWHHLMPVIIAIALLGFGIAASIACCLVNVVMAKPKGLLAVCAGLSLICFPLSFVLAQQIPLNMLALPWNWRQGIFLLLYALCFLLPLLFAASYITLVFIRWPERISVIYCADLLGAGFGALCVWWFIENDALNWAFYSCLSLVYIALFIQLPHRLSYLSFVFFAGLIWWLPLSGDIEPNQFKELPVRLQERGAQVIWQGDSSQSRITVVDSPGQHSAPGLSLNSEQAAPRQWQLFKDGDSSQPLLLDGGQYGLFAQSLGAGPYLLANKRPRVLLFGNNLSWDAWNAHWAQAGELTVVHPNSSLLAVLSGQLSAASFLPDNTNLVVSSPRRYITEDKTFFDVIWLDASSPQAGVFASKVNYLLTLEGLDAAYTHLSPSGILVITSRLGLVPQGELRVINTLAQLVKGKGLSLERRLVTLNDWHSVHIVLGKQVFPQTRVQVLASWSQRWAFDLMEFPGRLNDKNPVYHSSAIDRGPLIEALSRAGDVFTLGYVFDISPVTDSRPYFYHGFRWSTWTQLKAQAGSQWPLFVEWSYLLELLALPTVTACAALLIFTPLLLGPTRHQLKSISAPVISYFSAIGLGFMLVEILLLQKVQLLMNSATDAFTLVVTAMLTGAGVGSLCLGALKLTSKVLLLLALGVGVGVLVASAIIDALLLLPPQWPAFIRYLLLGLTCFSLAFVMGIFLPQGVASIRSRGPGVVAWAWGINGFASVLGALAASLIAMDLGFYALNLCAGVLYLWAALVSRKLAVDGSASAPRHYRA